MRTPRHLSLTTLGLICLPCATRTSHAPRTDAIDIEGRNPRDKRERTRRDEEDGAPGAHSPPQLESRRCL